MQERKLTSTDKYFIQQHSKHKVINHSQRMAIISTKPDTNNNLAVCRLKFKIEVKLSAKIPIITKKPWKTFLQLNCNKLLLQPAYCSDSSTLRIP